MESDLICLYENLNFDEACVSIKSPADSNNLWLYTLSSDCVSCPYTRTVQIENSSIASLTVNTARSQTWRLVETSGEEKYIPAASESGLYCQLALKIDQYGIYEITADERQCDLKTIKEPTSPYIDLTIAFGTTVLLLLALLITKSLKNLLNKNRPRTDPNDVAENPRAKKRVRSLDTVRGMSILLMIFVNNGAAGYAFLEHATWNGLLVGDLVFPCFMWIMGVCIPLSISSQLSRGIPRLSVCWAIVKRSIYLFFIGVALNTVGGDDQLENIRIFGVLQRFGVCYLVTGTTYALSIPPQEKNCKWKAIRDIEKLLSQWTSALVILALHCIIIFCLPIPDCPKGYLGPGGRHADGKYFNCTGGATGYVDKALLGINHIYQLPTANSVYGSGPFDPEGVLGCLTSIFQVFLGIQAGQILREYGKWKSRVIRWLLWSILLGAVGLILHFTDAVPINKNLWSISFVLITTCFALILLSVCYLTIDVIGIWQGGPFRIPGMNALVMYIGHQVFFETFPFHWKIGEMNTHGWLLAESLWCVGLWTCIAYVLHRKKLYITL